VLPLWKRPFRLDGLAYCRSEVRERPGMASMAAPAITPRRPVFALVDNNRPLGVEQVLADGFEVDAVFVNVVVLVWRPAVAARVSTSRKGMQPHS
jgi:hypothetical protein